VKAVIDRFEGAFAICVGDDKKIIEIKINKLPVGSVPGQVISIEGETIVIDRAATEDREMQIKKKMEHLWE